MNVLYPVFALFLLTAIVSVRLGYLRYAAVKGKQVDANYYLAYQGQEPEQLRIASRHMINLFEQPILFYVACVIAYISNQTGSTVVMLAWLYVGLRCVHTFIHLGSNVLINRFRVFVLCGLVLVALWAVLFLGLVLR
jgi:hypothetical protein